LDVAGARTRIAETHLAMDTDKPTTEPRRQLCNAKRDRFRCIRQKGHADDHVAVDVTRATTWK